MRLPLASLLVILIIPNLCRAWGGEAHQLSALIAEEKMTPQARAAVSELLDGVNISGAEVANWADEIRRERRDTARWHYVTIPHDAAAFDAERDGRSGANVIDAIERQTKVLADESQPREKRVEALKYVVHFVADLHQPLHCVDRDGDRGGNGRLVFYRERRQAVSLHFVWDTLLVRDMVGKRKIADVAAALLEKNFINEQEWPKGTPEAWANEAHGIAIGSAYLGVPADGPPPKLTPRYVQQARGTAETQLKRAGVRLAATLNAAIR